VPPKPDWIAPLAESRWAAHTGWLANPASEGKHSTERKGEVIRFAVVEASKGMKWSWDLPEPAPLEGHRYISMRYRGTGLRPVGDYALCVLGKPRTAGLDYTPVISDTELLSDGRWHTLTVDVRKAAARFPAIGALALQVQAASPDATLEVADIRFVNAIQPSKLSDALDWQPGARFDGFAAIPLGDAAKGNSDEWRRHLRLADWFSARDITACGVPFRLGQVGPVGPVRPVGPPEPARPTGHTSPTGPTGPIPLPLAATGIRAKAELRFPCNLKTSEVYLLLLAAFIGPEEPVFGGGEFRSIRDLDRFRLRLEYADGTADECLPLNDATKQFGIVPGPQVLVAAADPSKPLKTIILRDASKQAAFAVAAVTARTRGDAAFHDARDESAALAAATIRFPRTLVGGQAPTVERRFISLADGNWRVQLDAYLARAKESLKPLAPRKPWFREVFSFRQRFLHAYDPLYDHRTGEYRMNEALEQDRREFGGVDYLHLFDWGNCGQFGRIYGRTGDYSPYDHLKGGRDALRKAIEGVQKQGVPVGLYIEGYLLTARGKLGQAHGKDWQIVTRDGKPLWWPGNEEMMICPGVPAWREVQASTYETKVKELGVDGMYIDQFGFADPWKDCYCDKHGHPVPSCPAVTERETTRLIRERVEKARPGLAIYTEETPVDVTTPFQDGSFTYAMSEARRTPTLVPINIARFAFPDFKTIEILVCDKPTGSWATGVRWVFFNGEAIWLEGPPEWFEPETREAIRRCYRILRKHKDAFTSPDPVPLVPTEMGGVWANKFPVERKTVYTLYNARHRTVRGEALRVPHEEGATYYDEWRERPAAVRRDGNDAIISVEIGPNDVGCVVVETK
jgi:hypothetical protein